MITRQTLTERLPTSAVPLMHDAAWALEMIACHRWTRFSSALVRRSVLVANLAAVRRLASAASSSSSSAAAVVHVPLVPVVRLSDAVLGLSHRTTSTQAGIFTTRAVELGARVIETRPTLQSGRGCVDIVSLKGGTSSSPSPPRITHLVGEGEMSDAEWQSWISSLKGSDFFRWDRVQPPALVTSMWLSDAITRVRRNAAAPLPPLALWVPRPPPVAKKKSLEPAQKRARRDASSSEAGGGGGSSSSAASASADAPPQSAAQRKARFAERERALEAELKAELLDSVYGYRTVVFSFERALLAGPAVAASLASSSRASPQYNFAFGNRARVTMLQEALEALRRKGVSALVSVRHSVESSDPRGVAINALRVAGLLSDASATLLFRPADVRLVGVYGDDRSLTKALVRDDVAAPGRVLLVDGALDAIAAAVRRGLGVFVVDGTVGLSPEMVSEVTRLVPPSPRSVANINAIKMLRWAAKHVNPQSLWSRKTYKAGKTAAVIYLERDRDAAGAAASASAAAPPPPPALSADALLQIEEEAFSDDDVEDGTDSCHKRPPCSINRARRNEEIAAQFKEYSELLLLVEKEDKHVAGGGAAAAFKSKNYAKKGKEFKSLRESIRTGDDLEQLRKKEPAKMKWLTPKFLTKVLNMEDNNWIFDKLSELKQHPNIVALQDLCRIWGVANATAQKLINLGYSSIAALRALKNADGSDSTALRQLLAPQQRIGLRHVEDFEARIPRAEITALGDVVKRAAREAFAQMGDAGKLRVEICGSYRRGALHSGDMDVLICTRDTALIFHVLAKLNEEGFITENLAAPTPHPADMLRPPVKTAYTAVRSRMDAEYVEGDKKPIDFTKFAPKKGGTGDSTAYSWMGVAKIGADGVHRRIDIKAYPPQHFPFALLYFTGSAHLNRSMRLWAKKAELQLNDKSLHPRDSLLNCAPCETERDIFTVLRLPYIQPNFR